MKRMLLALFTVSLVTSTWVSATETAAPVAEQAATKMLAITEGKLKDTEGGCACSYTVKNLQSSPLKKFEAYIFVKNEQGRFRCDAAHFSFNKPIQPNESRTLANEAYGKTCGKNPSVSLLMVGTCNYADGSECDSENIETTDSGLKWVD
ncbi:MULTISPECIES: hypothetical protein [unclassified Symbiopectobacterium]|uniref:hypothetical protein n=1 Tax=unclassified Symbiopectobacterium TaxID=2794573 RepID=UPI0022263ADF|nr:MULTISPECIES: hypothetical protein [unclassified Symbiopectobacterium]MCW2473377.1 hypothetical protein [Candidatus Symbiopectobacterium sp. NZEC151]MCW2481946.1 hypothetical protein [Candidatus Symbiopectobacterium sp. NZEC135]MCW2484530.1 hypothetical protein [Candidatus Symbiopectobacterium sp. NZEC127]